MNKQQTPGAQVNVQALGGHKNAAPSRSKCGSTSGRPEECLPVGLCLQIESNIVRCPVPDKAEEMIAAIDSVRVKGDSCGGVVTCVARNVPRVSCLPQAPPSTRHSQGLGATPCDSVLVACSGRFLVVQQGLQPRVKECPLPAVPCRVRRVAGPGCAGVRQAGGRACQGPHVPSRHKGL